MKNKEKEDENVFEEISDDDDDPSDDEYEGLNSGNPEIMNKIFDWQAAQEEQIGGMREKAMEVDRAWDGVWDVLFEKASVPISDDIQRGVNACLTEQLEAATNAIEAMKKLTTSIEKLRNKALASSIVEKQTTKQRQRRSTFSRIEDLNLTQEVVADTAALKETVASLLKPTNNDVYVEATVDVAANADEDDDLPLKKGDKILVLDMSDTDGWWEGRKLSDGSTGFFPSNFVKRIEAPKQNSSLAIPR